MHLKRIYLAIIFEVLIFSFEKVEAMNVLGYLDIIDRKSGVVFGWTKLKGDDKSRLNVSIYVLQKEKNNKLTFIAEGNANLPREDLRGHDGCKDIHHGFAISIPPHWRDRIKGHKIFAYVQIKKNEKLLLPSAHKDIQGQGF